MKLIGSALLLKIEELKAQGITGEDIHRACGYEDADVFRLETKNANENSKGNEPDEYNYTDKRVTGLELYNKVLDLEAEGIKDLAVKVKRCGYSDQDDFWRECCISNELNFLEQYQKRNPKSHARDLIRPLSVRENTVGSTVEKYGLVSAYSFVYAIEHEIAQAKGITSLNTLAALNLVRWRIDPDSLSDSDDAHETDYGYHYEQFTNDLSGWMLEDMENDDDEMLNNLYGITRGEIQEYINAVDFKFTKKCIERAWNIARDDELMRTPKIL